jgi:hypothetical protein
MDGWMHGWMDGWMSRLLRRCRCYEVPLIMPEIGPQCPNLRQALYRVTFLVLYKVVKIWPGLIVCKQVTVCPGHIWTTLYTNHFSNLNVVSIGSAWCTRISREHPQISKCTWFLRKRLTLRNFKDVQADLIWNVFGCHEERSGTTKNIYFTTQNERYAYISSEISFISS